MVQALTTPLKYSVATTPMSMARADSRLPLTEVFTLLIMEMPASTQTDSRALMIICIAFINY